MTYDYGPVIFGVGITLFMGLMFFMIYSYDTPLQEYCEEQGYDRAKSDRKLIDGHYRINCYKEIVINNTLIEVDDWIRWDKPLVSSGINEK